MSSEPLLNTLNKADILLQLKGGHYPPPPQQKRKKSPKKSPKRNTAAAQKSRGLNSGMGKSRREKAAQYRRTKTEQRQDLANQYRFWYLEPLLKHTNRPWIVIQPKKKNTAYRPTTNFPRILCTAPYKYDFVVFYKGKAEEGFKEIGMDLILKDEVIAQGMTTKLISRRQITPEYQWQYFHLQFHLTSFKFKNKLFRIRLHDQMFTSGFFKTVARKQAIQHNFWAPFVVENMEEKPSNEEIQTFMNNCLENQRNLSLLTEEEAEKAIAEEMKDLNASEDPTDDYEEKISGKKRKFSSRSPPPKHSPHRRDDYE